MTAVLIQERRERRKVEFAGYSVGEVLAFLESGVAVASTTLSSLGRGRISIVPYAQIFSVYVHDEEARRHAAEYNEDAYRRALADRRKARKAAAA